MSKRVLLVEDERDTRELLGAMLRRAGYDCCLAADFSAALAQLQSPQELDVVITDIVLALDDRAGLKILAEARKRARALPVLMITAYADVSKVKFALNSGADYLLEKPFSGPDLLEALRHVQAAAAERGPAKFDKLFSSASLTHKERAVARHLLAGLSGVEIADLEQNSPKTIRHHITQIYSKCGVGSRAELFRLVYEG